MTEEPVHDYCSEALASGSLKPNGGATSGPNHSNADPASNQQTADSNKNNEEGWPVMDEAAYYGLAGDEVRTIGPHTEADPVAFRGWSVALSVGGFKWFCVLTPSRLDRIL
jgi:hypothetical protein